jgi:hypothetical protein
MSFWRVGLLRELGVGEKYMGSQSLRRRAEFISASHSISKRFA